MDDREDVKALTAQIGTLNKTIKHLETTVSNQKEEITSRDNLINEATKRIKDLEINNDNNLNLNLNNLSTISNLSLTNNMELHDLDEFEFKNEEKLNDELKDVISTTLTDINDDVVNIIKEDLPLNELYEWKDFDIKEEEKRRTLYLSNNKISINESDNYKQKKLLGLLFKAGIKNNHYEILNNDLRIRIINIGAFAKYQVFIKNKDIAEKALENINFVIKQQVTQNDSSLRCDFHALKIKMKRNKELKCNN